MNLSQRSTFNLPTFDRWWWRFVGWGFTQLYTNFAWAYDAVAWAVSGGQWREWGQAALPRIKGSRVLEIGSGPGHLLVALAEEGHTPFAIDVSPQMIRLAGRRLRQQNLRANLVRGRAQALPWPDGHFDTVVMTFPAGFILESQTFDEIRRVLRPSGRVVIVDGGRLYGGAYSRLVGLAFRVTHGSGVGAKTLGDLCEEAGFTVTFEVERWPDSSVDVLIGVKG